MRKKFVTALVALALLMPVVGFGAEMQGPYASVSGMLVMPRDSKANDKDLGVRGKFGLDNGAGFAVATGYAFGGGLRTEIEFGYRGVKVNSLTIDPVEYTYIDTNDDERTITLEGKAKMKAKVRTFSLMANALYAFQDLGLPVLPYAGAGIGWARHKVGDMTFPGVAGYRIEGDSANAFAYQFMVGIKYPIDNLELGVGYRLVGTTEADFDGTKIDYLTHNFELGVTFRF